MQCPSDFFILTTKKTQMLLGIGIFRSRIAVHLRIPLSKADHSGLKNPKKVPYMKSAQCLPQRLM